MAILTDTRCLLCHFNKNVDTARGLGTEAQATAFARELMKIYLDSPEDVGVTWYGPATAELFDRFYGVGPDRFVEEKRRSNAFVLERLAQIRARIEGSEDPVLAALKFAILGNYIDFSALYGEMRFEKLEEMLVSALEMELDLGVYRSLCHELERGGKLLYLTDNAGEIGFDRLFAEAIAETLLDSGYNIYYAFLAKCVRFMERYKCPKLTPMLVKERN